MIERTKDDHAAGASRSSAFRFLRRRPSRHAAHRGGREERTRSRATDDDPPTLEVAIDAKRYNANIRVIVRIFDQRVAEEDARRARRGRDVQHERASGLLVALQATEPCACTASRTAAPRAWKSRRHATGGQDGRGLRGPHRWPRDRREEATGALSRARHDTKIAEGDVVTLDLPAASVAKVRG